MEKQRVIGFHPNNWEYQEADSLEELAKVFESDYDIVDLQDVEVHVIGKGFKVNVTKTFSFEPLTAVVG